MKHITTIFTLFAAVLQGSVSYDLAANLPIVKCSNNNTCQLANSFCDDQEMQHCNVSICACQPTHVAVQIDPSHPNRYACLEKVENIGDLCEHDTQCTDSFGILSVCLPNTNEKICQCKPEAAFCEESGNFQKQCRPLRQLGESCDAHCSHQCSHIANSSCMSSVYMEEPLRCQCNADYISSNDNSRCLPITQKYNESCEIQEQCQFIPETICDPDLKTCFCNETTHAPSTGDVIYCLQKKFQLNSKCLLNSQCAIENSYCDPQPDSGYTEGICRCITGYFMSERIPNKCLKENTNVGEPCTEDLQCTRYMGENSECSGTKGMTCQCKHGFHSDGQYYGKWGICFPLVPLGGKCFYHGHCVDANGSNGVTECYGLVSREDGGTCICKGEDMTDYNGLCYKNRLIGEACDFDFECQLGISGPIFCDYESKTCKCDEYHFASPDKSECFINDVIG